MPRDPRQELEMIREMLGFRGDSAALTPPDWYTAEATSFPTADADPWIEMSYDKFREGLSDSPAAARD